MRLLLDTAALIHAIEAPEQFSRRALDALENLDNVLEISAVSLTEIAIKAALGKLRLNAEITRQMLDVLDIRVLSFTADHAFTLFALPSHHTDPFDRQIIAQALAEDVPVVTSDRIFRKYRSLEIIW